MSTPFETKTIVPATNAQILYVMRLLGERNWQTSGADDKAIARAAALHLALTWSMRPMAESTPPAISRLINNTVGRNESYGERANVILDYLRNGGETGVPVADTDTLYKPFTKAGASALIDWLTACPKAAAASTAAVSTTLTDGIYITEDGSTVKVQEARNGSGRLYAKLMDRDTGKFEYVGGLVGKVAAQFQHGAARRLTLELAKEYGALYGRCIECGRDLTDEDSIARGVGPICAQKFA